MRPTRIIAVLVLLVLTRSLSPQEERLKAAKEPKPDLLGIVEAVAADGKALTVKVLPTKARPEARQLSLKITEQTKLTYEKVDKPARPGYAVEIWLEKGSTDRATALRFRTADSVRVAKPGEGRSDPRVAAVLKDEPNLKDYVVPKRDPAPSAALIDEQVDRLLRDEGIPVSGPADDAEFLRRVTLDLTGRVPGYQRTVAFLASTDPHKRRNLIEDLLASPAYSEHFATIWRNLIVGGGEMGKDRSGRDVFALWLTEQFDKNRGWNEIATDMLTADGPIAKTPATTFTLSNAENMQPQPARLADATARFFWGLQLRCAECHDHPFAQWKQTDFWATAAFFSRVRNTGGRGEEASLTEADGPQRPPVTKRDGPSQPVPAGAILIPGTAGKGAGKVVKARFLGGAEPDLGKDGPYRPRFAAWATAADNPYFARAAVNRWWAHFFGRGLVEPVDGFDDANEPSHPELLDKLTREFTASGFDLKHLSRVIVSSKAYQRTSRPVAGNEDDKRLISHTTLKQLSPEAFYDSILVVTGGNSGGVRVETRADFVKSSRPLSDSGVADGYQQGIPHVLKLLNTPLLNNGAPVVNMLVQSGKSRPEAIEAIYLAALVRRPTETEVRLMTGYLERHSNVRDGYVGMLWILLNSGEFVLNH